MIHTFEFWAKIGLSGLAVSLVFGIIFGCVISALQSERKTETTEYLYISKCYEIFSISGVLSVALTACTYALKWIWT